MCVYRIYSIVFFLALSHSHHLAAQDSIKHLPDITIVGHQQNEDDHDIPNIVGTRIFAGKKGVFIEMKNVQANLSQNTMRQVLAKVPGVHIWESDPSGVQIGIAQRGLSPNRSWEMNIRQNGYDIAADPYGYPEAYYNPQLQAVQRIEIVRGHGALQYGSQLGGMVNYILRNGNDLHKPLHYEAEQTIGSNALFNSYHAVGGKKGRWHYFTFYNHRQGNGWRQNSVFATNSAFVSATYSLTPATKITAEVMYAQWRTQQPGGIADTMIRRQARESLRSRNWMDIQWCTPALHLKKDISLNAAWETTLFATLGNKNSIGFLLPLSVKDSINGKTNAFNHRLVNEDEYRNYGLESRWLQHYPIGKLSNTLSAGVRLYTGSTHRRADGKGTTGSNYDLSIEGQHPRDIHFYSYNAALFFENIFNLSKRLKLVPGIRWEWLKGTAQGRYGFSVSGEELLLQRVSRNRSFMLAGIGTVYQLRKSKQLYANITQGYRPIQFANLQAPPSTDVIDENLKDAKGFNADVGFKGKIKNWLSFDLSVYWLQYNNRIGTLTVSAPTTYRYITNVGSSSAKGIEGYAACQLLHSGAGNRSANVQIFATYAYTRARYSAQHKEEALRQKKVENAPEHILRSGISVQYRQLMVTTQVSYVSATYSDANNTLVPTANAVTGLIPSYTVCDFTLAVPLSNALQVKAGVNNLFDERYFTRRAAGYPGPGVMPADGRTAFVSIAARF